MLIRCSTALLLSASVSLATTKPADVAVPADPASVFTATRPTADTAGSPKAVADAFFADAKAGRLDAVRARLHRLAENDPARQTDFTEQVVDELARGIMTGGTVTVHDGREEGDVALLVVEFRQPAKQPKVDPLLMFRQDGQWRVSFLDGDQIKGTILPDAQKKAIASLMGWAARRTKELKEAGVVGAPDPKAEAQHKLNTGLALAAAEGDLEKAKKLLAEGAHLDGPAYMLGSPLKAAVERNKREMIRWLIKQGAKVDPPGSSLLMKAIADGEPETVALLIELGADVNRLASDYPDGMTPIYQAALFGKFDLLKLMLDKGGKPVDEKNRTTLLHYAAQSGDLKTFELVRPLYKDLTIKDADGSTALHMVAKEHLWSRGNEHAAIARILLDAGVDPKAESHGSMALHYGSGSALTFASQGWQGRGGSVVPVLVERVRYTPDELTTALRGVARYNTADVLKLLLDKGAEPAPHVLQAAVEYRRADNVKLLLDRGANPNAPANANRQTALHIAVAASTPEVVSLVLARGGDKTLKDTDGQTPVDLAHRRLQKGREINGRFHPEFPEFPDAGVQILKQLDPTAETPARAAPEPREASDKF